MWPVMGWFAGFVLADSVAGAACALIRMQYAQINFGLADSLRTLSRQQIYKQAAVVYRLLVSFLVFYVIEFLCMIIAKLLLLGRLTNHAARNSKLQVAGIDNAVARKWGSGRALLLFHRAIAAATLLCSVVAAVAYLVTAGVEVQFVSILDKAAAACDDQGNDTAASLALVTNGTNALEVTFTSAYAVENYLESSALLLICIDYLVVVALSVALFRQAEEAGNHALMTLPGGHHNSRTEAVAAVVEVTMQAAVAQRRRLSLACGIVLLTFPLRVAYAILNALSLRTLPSSECDYCDTCQSTAWLVRTWLVYTPEFEAIVIAFSSPLPLIMSLWLITAAHRRALEIAADIQRIPAL